MSNGKKRKNLATEKEKEKIKIEQQYSLKEKIREAEYILNRIDGWINNCDNKTSMVFGMFGVILTIILTTDGIKLIIHIIQSACKQMEKSCFGNFLFLFIFAFGIIILLYGLIRFFMTIFARIDEDQYRDDKLEKDSLIFYGTISKKRFTNFQKNYVEATNEELLTDILSQIYINSMIAKAKYRNYNIGLKYFVEGIVLCGIMILLGMLVY